jgi:ankyrin repeat protein
MNYYLEKFMNLKDKLKVIKLLNKGDNEKLKLFINEKPELLYATNEYNYTLLEIACHNNNLEAVQFFLEKKVPFKESSAFLCASHGYQNLLLYLIDEKIISKDIKDNGNNHNSHGDNLLMIAASSGHVNLIEKLIEKGINFDEVNNKGESALYAAIIYGEEEVVQYLISIGANTECLSIIKKEDIKLENDVIENLITTYQEKKQIEQTLTSDTKSTTALKI